MVCFSYGGLDVPDTMNVHGVYAMKAYTLISENKETHQTFLQQTIVDNGEIEDLVNGAMKSVDVFKATMNVDIYR